MQNVVKLSEISNVDISFGVVACEHCGITASDKSLQFQIQSDLACMKVFMSSIHPKHGLTKVTKCKMDNWSKLGESTKLPRNEFNDRCNSVTSRIDSVRHSMAVVGSGGGCSSCW